MMKTSKSFGFSSSLLFFIVASIAVYSEAQSICLYRLYVQTGSVAEAGTDSRIGVTFGNLVGDSVKISNLITSGVMPPGHAYFKSGNLDIFLVEAPCMKMPFCKMTVSSDGGGQKSKWYLENVSVDSLFSGTRTKFEFNQWLAIDKPPYKLTASRDVCQRSTTSTNKSINDF